MEGIDAIVLSGGLAPAEVYVIRPERLGELSAEPWDRMRFLRETLPDFLRALRRG